MPNCRRIKSFFRVGPPVIMPPTDMLDQATKLYVFTINLSPEIVLGTFSPIMEFDIILVFVPENIET